MSFDVSAHYYCERLSDLSEKINIKLGNQLSVRAVAASLPVSDRKEILLQQ